MNARPCSNHPSVAALFRCDGCRRQLCRECIREGHRLLFCGVCGERALPLENGQPATTPALRRATRQAAAYGFADALGYPFRGLGLYLYVGYIVLVFLLRLLGFLPGIGCLAGIYLLVIAFLVPGLLFAIVRTTAAGENELPDWPDFTEVGERLREVFSALLVVLTSLVPAAALLWLAGCDLRSFLDVSARGAGCWVALAAGLLAAFVLAVPGFGATGTYSSPWLSFRLDLHLRALAAGGRDSVEIIGFLFAFSVLSQVLELVFAFVPLVGSIAATALDTYSSFVGAHLLGLLFRRHAAEMDRIYVG